MGKTARDEKCKLLTIKMYIYIYIYSLRTNIYATHEPPTIACACIWLACRDEQIKLPCTVGQEWWLLFDVDFINFKNVAGHIKRLYYRKLDKPNLPIYKEEVEKWLNKRRGKSRMNY